jgi:hypothetical protein
MFRPFAYVTLLLTVLGISNVQGEQPESTQKSMSSSFKAFTGKVIGNHVRMRTAPDLDSHIVAELLKDDYIVVSAQKGEFYAVEPPANMNAYIFRGFVIDNVVEGERVNVRLSPDREAPVVGHHSTGTKISGKICEENNKWLEISMPQDTRFYVAKEYIEYAGKPEMKIVHDKRKEAARQLFDSTQLLTQKELVKPFHEIDADRITHNYQTIINDYADFSNYVNQSTKALAQFQEDYLQRKIAYLEAKASKIGGHATKEDLYHDVSNRFSDEHISPTDRMKIWEPVEEALYLSWSAMHHAKTMDDFYQDQKLKSQTISGILESYKEPIKSRPGDFILTDREAPIGYVYSTHVNLEDLVGKRVTLIVTPRENNNFAFPAYYVLDAE